MDIRTVKVFLEECIENFKKDISIENLPKTNRKYADELYKLCNDYMHIYEDQTKWENIDYNKIKYNG